jgi:hypothetical protein
VRRKGVTARREKGRDKMKGMPKFKSGEEESLFGTRTVPSAHPEVKRLLVSK